MGATNKATLQMIDRALTTQSRFRALVSKNVRLLSVFGLVTLLYLVLTAKVPLNSAATQHYHLTAVSAAVVILSVQVPMLVIWLIALVGYLRLKSYADSIQQSRDGDAFRLIAAGVLWLTLWLPLSGILSTLQRYAQAANPKSLPLAVYLSNYGNLAIMLLAVLLIYFGSRRLLFAGKVQERFAPIGIGLYIVFASLYTFLVLLDPARLAPVSSMQAASYYTQDWLTILTLIIPFLLAWGIGFQAAYNLFSYRMNVKGKIYRRSLTGLALGVAGITSAIAVLRVVQSLAVHINNLSLAAVLLLVYVLLVIIAFGYVAIARGAKTLQRIENV